MKPNYGTPYHSTETSFRVRWSVYQTSSMRARILAWTPWAAILLVLLATGIMRWRLLQTPLERDEGEFAYMGQLMLQGIPPYQLAANMKLPGTYGAYALILAMFGQTIVGIHLGLLLVNAAAIVMVGLLGMRLFGTGSGIAASAAYALLSIGSEVMGTQAHATHFVVVFALGGVLLLLRYSDSGRWSTLWWSGLLFGLAFLMKQPGILFGVFGLVWLAVTGRRELRSLPAKLLVFAAGLTAPFVLTCWALWHAGVFQKFWFWTFTYARQYASEVSLDEGWDDFTDAFGAIFLQNPALWTLALAGLVSIWWKRKPRPAAAFVTALLITSFLAVCPGLYFRGHYFVLLLPAVALLAGAAARERVTYCVLGIAILLSLFTQREFLFRMTPVQADREMYGRSPFPEAIPVATYIRSHSRKDTRIAVLGSEPEIYFYADRLPATSYLYTYGLMESQPYALTMQRDMIQEVTAAAPEFVVDVLVSTSWQRDEDSPTLIFDWWPGYRDQHYRLVGVADILSPVQTIYKWDADAEAYHPQSQYQLLVYRRGEVPASVSRLALPAMAHHRR